jgi:hypothetical protein
MNSLHALFVNVSCRECSSTAIAVQNREKYGFAIKFTVKCQPCDFIVSGVP